MTARLLDVEKVKGNLTRVIKAIDGALGRGTAREQPLLVGLVACAAELSGLRALRGPYSLGPRSSILRGRTSRDEQLHRRLIAAWASCFGEKAATCRDAISYVRTSQLSDMKDSAGELAAVLQEITATRRPGVHVTRSLGRWLQRYSELRVEGRGLQMVGERDHTAIWKIETTCKGAMDT